MEVSFILRNQTYTRSLQHSLFFHIKTMDQVFQNDFVELKSGGPKMKVIEVGTNDYVYCSWKNKRNDEMFGSFPIHTIIKAQQTDNLK